MFFTSIYFTGLFFIEVGVVGVAITDGFGSGLGTLLYEISQLGLFHLPMLPTHMFHCLGALSVIVTGLQEFILQVALASS